MRLAVPILLAALLLAVGRHYSGWPAGLFLAALGLAVGVSLGRLVRGRAVRSAPPPPAPEPGEQPRLHGPVQVLQAGGPRDCWGYLSDRRLSLVPLEGAEGGAELRLDALDEVRPAKAGLFGGTLTVVHRGQAWKMKVPDAKRWERALRDGGRG